MDKSCGGQLGWKGIPFGIIKFGTRFRWRFMASTGEKSASFRVACMAEGDDFQGDEGECLRSKCVRLTADQRWNDLSFGQRVSGFSKWWDGY